jgi:hypothetical protein
VTDYSDWTKRMVEDARLQAESAPQPDGGLETVPEETRGDLATGPLSQMLLDNAPLIEAAANAYGAASVAAFFIDLGAGIATANGLETLSEYPTTNTEGTES